ncbi:DUF115 domain-containing protein [Alphaproteobacteria bacterium]|nr:DUF115 domain-containing protein [Alphaproteobacteria bacterium]
MKLDKIELNRNLHQELIAVDALIEKYGVEENDKLTRDCIDQRRQLFAEYERTLTSFLSATAEGHEDTGVYQVEPELDEFISLWCGQIRNLEFRPIYLTDTEYCQRFIDCYLPKSWNWETDFVLLVNPFDDQILLELLKRGQKNVIIMRTKTSKVFDKNIVEQFGEFWEISSLKELEQSLIFYPRKVNNICHFDCLGHSETEIDSETISKIIKEGIYARQLNMNTIGKHSIKWATNTIKNIPNILSYKNINCISMLGSRTGVIVSPGPSLEKNVHLLKKYADKIFIICPVRTVAILRANDVEPDFVLQLDAIGGDFVKNSLSSLNTPVQNLVMDATVDPDFFNFPAEKKYWYFTHNKAFGLEDHIDIGEFGLEAVSVSIACLKFAYKFGLTKLVLIGQDLAFSPNKRYADGGGLGFLPKLAPDVLVDGYYGGKVGTAADYDFFIDQFAELGQLMSDAGCEMYNCTEGGAHINNFHQIPLAELLGGLSPDDRKVFRERKDVSRSFLSSIQFCKNSKELIIKVQNHARRALEIEKKGELTVNDIRSRDKCLRKMVKLSDQSKILWWAFQDILMNTQELTYRKETVTDLIAFLEEILEITTLMINNLSHTETKLLGEVISNEK